jgi:hypothetical protein
MKIHRWIILLALILLFSSLAQQTVITPLRETIHQAEALVAGDVQKVLAGTLRPADYKTLPLGEVLFALGAGSIEKMEDTGEMLAVGGRAYVKTSDELLGFPLRNSQGKITTPFALGVKKNQGPGAVYYLSSPAGIAVSELYGYLLPRAKGRAGIIIYGRWRSLATTALKRAPIYGEPIMQEQNRSRYFHPQEFLWERTALTCGLAVVRGKVAPAEQPLLSHMFYVNFADVRQNSNDVLDHTHVLVLGENQGPPPQEEDLKALLAGKEPAAADVRHLLSQSLLLEGFIYLYPLASFHEFPPAP